MTPIVINILPIKLMCQVNFDYNAGLIGINDNWFLLLLFYRKLKPSFASKYFVGL